MKIRLRCSAELECGDAERMHGVRLALPRYWVHVVARRLAVQGTDEEVGSRERDRRLCSAGTTWCGLHDPLHSVDPEQYMSCQAHTFKPGVNLSKCLSIEPSQELATTATNLGRVQQVLADATNIALTRCIDSACSITTSKGHPSSHQLLHAVTPSECGGMEKEEPKSGISVPGGYLAELST